MLIWANIAVHLVFFLFVVVLGGYGAFDLAFAFLGFLTIGSFSHLALRLATRRHGNGLGALTIGLVIFFWVAYTAKFGVAMVISDEYWVVPSLIDATTLHERLPEAYFTAMAGFVSIMVGIFAFPLRHSIDWRLRPGRGRMFAMMLLLSICLAIKYWLKDRFFIGVPGVEPVRFLIPYLSGILALLLGYGFMFLANIPFFLALASGSRFFIFVSFIAAVINAGIDLRFGSKDTLVFQVALTVAYLFVQRAGFESGHQGFRKNKRLMLVVMGIVGVAVVSVYKYLNFIRFAFLAGSTDIADAISMAAQSDVAQSRSSLIEILNRITGIEAYTAVKHIVEEHSFYISLSDLLDGSLLRQFSDFYLAGLDTSAAFSMTLIGSWYIYGGIPAIIVGLFVTGFVLSLIQHLILRTPGLPHNMRLAFLPIYWIMCVQLMLGGNPTIWIKTMIVTLPFVYLVGRIAFVPASQKNRGFDARHLAANP